MVTLQTFNNITPRLSLSFTLSKETRQSRVGSTTKLLYLFDRQVVLRLI